MVHPMYPCLWFAEAAVEAARWYANLFDDGQVLEASPVACRIRTAGTTLMLLNGGSRYVHTSAVSLYMHCGNDATFSRLYAALCDGGMVVTADGPAAWSPRYARVVDRYGITWQLDVQDLEGDQKMLPSVQFAGRTGGRIHEALAQYAAVMPGFSTEAVVHYPKDAADRRSGAVFFARVSVQGFLMYLTDSVAPEASIPTPAASFVLECDTQPEIDALWLGLGEGGRYSMCGWLEDRFGLSWQVIPSQLRDWMADPVKGPAVVAAFLRMQKFDISVLEQAGG